MHHYIIIKIFTYNDVIDGVLKCYINSPFVKEDAKSSQGRYDILSQEKQYYTCIITAAARHLHSITNLNLIPSSEEYQNLIGHTYCAQLILSHNYGYNKATHINMILTVFTAVC